MKKLLRAALTAQVLSLAAMAHAGPFDTTGSFVYYTFSGYRSDAVYTNTSEWVSASGATQGVNWGGDFPTNVTGHAAVAGQAGVGSARLSLTASGDGFMPLAYAGWTDQIVIDAPGQTGQHGTFSFQLRYDWTATATASPGGLVYAVPYVDANLTIPNGPWNTSQYGSVYQDVTDDCSAGACSHTDTWFTESSSQPKPSFGDGLATFSFNVVFGQTYNLTIGVNASLQGVYGSGAIDATHTVLWNGMSAVTGSTGQALGDYAVTSAIGLDYRSPVTSVPEPQTAALWAGGFLLLLGLRRRARR
ncbi:MAG TPA: hypothetical protein VN201_10280 [Roseateles sp.]|nr:hypothetical protein [Roseateles sp.]